jgi:hypothetical protein
MYQIYVSTFAQKNVYYSQTVFGCIHPNTSGLSFTKKKIRILNFCGAIKGLNYGNIIDISQFHKRAFIDISQFHKRAFLRRRGLDKLGFEIRLWLKSEGTWQDLKLDSGRAWIERETLDQSENLPKCMLARGGLLIFIEIRKNKGSSLCPMLLCT